MADSVASLRYLSSFMCLSNDIRFDLSIEEAKSAKKNKKQKKTQEIGSHLNEFDLDLCSNTAAIMPSPIVIR